MSGRRSFVVAVMLGAIVTGCGDASRTAAPPTSSHRAMLLATEDARRGVWLTLVSDLAQAYFQLLALEVVG